VEACANFETKRVALNDRLRTADRRALALKLAKPSPAVFTPCPDTAGVASS
jgi:hypothetical protein